MKDAPQQRRSVLAKPVGFGEDLRRNEIMDGVLGSPKKD